MATITDVDYFKAWLEGKPTDWAQVLAVRAALRVLPVVAATYLPNALTNWRTRLTLAVLRACAVSWTARNIPSQDMALAADQADWYAANISEEIKGDDDGIIYRAGHANNAVFNAASSCGQRYSGIIPAAHNSAYNAAIAISAYAIYRVTAHLNSISNGQVEFIGDSAPSTREERIDGAANVSLRSFWENLATDATWLESESTTATGILSLPLWSASAPGIFWDSWNEAKAALLQANQGFEVWVDWYERRIRGEPTAFDLPSTADAAVQIKLAEQNDAFWDQDPATLNATLQGWIKEGQEPEIPAQRPSELQTHIEDGRVRRTHVPPLPIDAARDARRRAAWQAIRDAVDDYLAGGPAENHPRLNTVISRLGRELAIDFEHLNPIGLGIQAQFLATHAASAGEILLPDRAADVVGLNITLGSFMPYFPEWQAYLDDPVNKVPITQAKVVAVADVVEAIKTCDVVDEDVKVPLSEMYEQAFVDQPDDKNEIADSDQINRRINNGLSNTLVSLSEGAVAYAKEFGGKLKAGSLKGAEKFGEQAMYKLLMTGSAAILTLATGLPLQFAWLIAVIAFLKSNAPKE